MPHNNHYFPRCVKPEMKILAEARFALRDGQMREPNIHKNLWWVLDGKIIGYGDLNQDDVEMIHISLGPNEVFLAYNEHHGTSWQQTPHAMIKITHEEITHPIREERAREKATR